MASATASKNYVLARRGNGIADLSEMTLETGESNLEEAESKGLYRINCTHQIGIATSTEVGLTADRFPLRVIVDLQKRRQTEVDTVVHYWKVTNSAGAFLPFQRKPFESDLAIKQLYRIKPDMDEDMWRSWGKIIVSDPVDTNDQALEQVQNELFDILSLLNPTDEQKARVSAIIGIIVVTCEAANRVPYFKISSDYFLRAKPHGTSTPYAQSAQGSKTALNETAACIALNHARLKARYDKLSDGAVTLAAYTAAAMFRFGLYESYEHKEYYTVVIKPVAANSSQFTVSEIIPPTGIAPPTWVTVGQAVDISKVRLSKVATEYANLLVFTSGLMHYLFNHTTGGMVMSGSLLTTLALYKIVNGGMNNDVMESLTSLFYEVLHPSNKRALANLFFKSSGVTSHGRCRGSLRYEHFSLDSFTQIRANPYPAGSHKAFVTLTALRRVLQSGLGPFLPWASQLDACINMCRDVLVNGARAHVGSGYYTGDPSLAQPASLDNYLPELAHYVNVFHKGDSLAMSPHLSLEHAAKAEMNWKNLIKDLKANDVSATGADVVRNFLATAGTVHFAFDPTDQGTWAGASGAAKLALQKVDTVFG